MGKLRSFRHFADAVLMVGGTQHASAVPNESAVSPWRQKTRPVPPWIPEDSVGENRNLEIHSVSECFRCAHCSGMERLVSEQVQLRWVGWPVKTAASHDVERSRTAAPPQLTPVERTRPVRADSTAQVFFAFCQRTSEGPHGKADSR